MIYGYNVIESQTIGHGCAWWDEYYETTEFKVLETKLFTSKDKFDEKVKELKEKYYYRLGDEIHIIEFETEDERYMFNKVLQNKFEIIDKYNK